MSPTLPEAGDVTVAGPVDGELTDLLTPNALAFVGKLVCNHQARLRQLLEARELQQAKFDAGALPGFLPETQAIRDSDWRVAAIPPALLDRRVEITSPPERKLIINALNAGAQGYMADFDDSACPNWPTMMAGQRHLRDAVAGAIDYTHPDTGERYTLGQQTAVLHMRPRSLHLAEPGLAVGGQPAPAALVDVGLFLFHNAATLIEQGRGPFVYLPKLESHHEAAWWAEVFATAGAALDLASGSIKATVIIETLPAAFQMDEILHALRQHAVGLSCGRWGSMFSATKVLHAQPARRWPGRQQLGMDQRFLDSLSKRLCQICHRRGALAIGGMANWVPVHNDEAANTKALERIRADKQRELDNGHDGTWVAHPALVTTAAAVFEALDGPNQLKRQLDWGVTADDLLAMPAGEILEADLRNNIGVFVQYIEAWLGGQGAVALYNLMEDASTAEICRVQVWHWLQHPDAALADGRAITAELFDTVLAEELEIIRAEVGDERFDSGRYHQAAGYMRALCMAPKCAAHFTDAVPVTDDFTT